MSTITRSLLSALSGRLARGLASRRSGEAMRRMAEGRAGYRYSERAWRTWTALGVGLPDLAPVPRESYALPFNIESATELDSAPIRGGLAQRNVTDLAVHGSFQVTIDGAYVSRRASDDPTQLLAVHDARGRPVRFPQLALGRSFPPVDTRSDHPPVGETALCLVNYFRNHYHWLLEALPRMLLAEQEGLSDNLLLPPERVLNPVQNESLLALGYTEAERFPEEATVVKARRLHLFCEDPRRAGALEPLRRRLLRTGTQVGPKLVYISRHRATKRRLTNEPDVAAMLRSRGFVTVAMEGKSFAQQEQLLSDTEILVATHGAGLANMLFCPKGAKVIEILPESRPVAMYYAIASALGLRYASVRSATVGDEPASRADVRVEIPKLERTLDLALQ